MAQAHKVAVRDLYRSMNQEVEGAKPITGNADDDVVCVIDENPYWHVEEIRDVQVDVKGKLMYLVKWAGYPENQNSWEPEENCSLARRLVTEFHQQMPEKKRNQLAQQMIAFSRMNKPPSPKPVKKVVRKPADGFPVKKPRNNIAKQQQIVKLKSPHVKLGIKKDYAELDTENGPGKRSNPWAVPELFLHLCNVVRIPFYAKQTKLCSQAFLSMKDYCWSFNYGDSGCSVVLEYNVWTLLCILHKLCCS